MDIIHHPAQPHHATPQSTQQFPPIVHLQCWTFTFMLLFPYGPPAWERGSVFMRTHWIIDFLLRQQICLSNLELCTVDCLAPGCTSWHSFSSINLIYR